MGERKSRILHLTLLLLLMSPPPAESFIFTAIATAISFAYQAYSIINDAHDTYKKFAPQTTLDDVLDQAKKVEVKVDQLGAQLSKQIDQAITTIVTQIDDLNNIREGIGKLSDGVRRIDNLYRLFELYTSKRISLNNYTLQNYINQITTTSALAPKDILNEIQDVIIPGGGGLRRSLLYYLSKDAPSNETIGCGDRALSQEKFYQLFKLIMVNEIRAFTMMSFAYSMDQVFKCESFKGEMDLAEYDLRERALQYYDVFSKVMENTANSIRNCDPPKGWKRGENFYELERFMSQYIISETRWFPEENCDTPCWGLMPPLRVDTCDEVDGCQPQTKCEGNLIHCQDMSRESVTVCHLGPEGRRFQWYKISGETYGNDEGGCNGDLKVITPQRGCAICGCTCVEDNYNSASLRAFSLRPQTSDIENNKVVTGIKFVSMGNMIHIQIQQGTILSEGKISPKSVEWKPLEEIRFDETKTMQKRTLKYYRKDSNGKEYEMKEYRDFQLFDYGSHKIYLDSFMAPVDYVITGVQLALNLDEPDNIPIQLQIQVSPFDYETGKIVATNKNPTKWLTAEDMVGVFKEYDEERTELLLPAPNNPEKEKGTYIPRPSINKWLQMTTSLYEPDGGQTTIPFLDAQEVAGNPPFAATGIGLYFKSIEEGGGGFLGFRVWKLEAMKYLHMGAINKLETFSTHVTEFKGCNNDLQVSE